MKKKIIIAAVVGAVLGAAFFFAEKPPETVITESSAAESSVEEVSEIVSEVIIPESSVEKVSKIVSESSVEEVPEIVSEVTMAESSVEEVSEIVSEVSVSESSAEEISEIVSEVSVSESSVEEISEIVSEISVAESSIEEISKISLEEVSEIQTKCTVSISCQTLLNNLDKVKKNKLSVIPSDGRILTAVSASFDEGESVFDVTKRVCMENRIPFEFTLAPVYNTAYIEGINNIYEFDCGSTSGWLYKVNGEFLSYGCSDCKLKDGDTVEWVYTCNLGKDVGNEYKTE